MENKTLQLERHAGNSEGHNKGDSRTERRKGSPEGGI